MTMSSEAGTPARAWREGLRVGITNELTCFFKIKPGRAQYIREATERQFADPGRAALVFKFGTVAEARMIIFDNDTQFAFQTVYEGDWDTYIEDFMPEVIPGLDRMFRGNLEDWITKPLAETTVDEVKTLLDAHRVTAAGFTWSLGDATLKEIWKALRVQKAFQQVLDDPAAQKALQDPALRPLLAEAQD
jgi:hypothetical protein